MPDRFYGGKKDKYNDKAVYHRPKVARLVLSTDYLNFCQAVRDQMYVGSCTGFGVGGMAYAIAKSLGINLADIWSPTWLYNWGRFIEGTLTQDAGASPDDVCDAAVMHGLLYEQDWPYDGNKFDPATPSNARIALAIKNLGLQKIRIADGTDNIIDALSSGIASVAIGVPFPKIWEGNSQPDILPIPMLTDIVGGWHEMHLFGHDITDPAHKYFRDQNSWGTSWANKGRCKIPYEFFDWARAQGGYDAHYFRMVNPGPMPVPPIHKKCWIF
jgi:hypothetical protein